MTQVRANSTTIFCFFCYLKNSEAVQINIKLLVSAKYQSRVTRRRCFRKFFFKKKNSKQLTLFIGSEAYRLWLQQIFEISQSLIVAYILYTIFLNSLPFCEVYPGYFLTRFLS